MFKKFPILVALVLALATPMTALATDQTSSASETLTVLPTTTLTGVPASIAYGSAITGTLSGPAFTPVADSNNAAGIQLDVGAGTTALTSGSNTIARTNRKFIAGTPSASCTLVGGAAGWASPGKALGSSGGLSICSSTGPVASMSALVTPTVVIPASQAAGAYTGTLVISVHELP